ncbi:MAG: 1-deoxy-D-xylulose-5-phosphate reductoisomerase [Burkholderiaceae bacterium]
MQQVTVLGATGSIGQSTLDVIARHRDRFDLFALTGHARIELLAEQCLKYQPRFAVVANETGATRLRKLIQGSTTEVLSGRAALAEVASAPAVDIVMAAIVGAAGLEPTLAAARSGKRVLLANKEALVMAGDLFMAAARHAGATVLPIDSEHNAVFQCLPAGEVTTHGGISRIVLTASGGPFREWSIDEMQAATPAQACAHPNWSMGRKISVDSATMMNKGLELIEAHYLFGVSHDKIDVLIHPESIVHSMVEYEDGSTLAQLGNPDMRTPIAHALAWPERIVSGVAGLSLADIGRLHFEQPDTLRFPCLALAIQAMQSGGACACILNAANEVAVQAFLDDRLGFNDIARINQECVARLHTLKAAVSIEEVLEQDKQAREVANSLVTD